jgi:NTE family protein
MDRALVLSGGGSKGAFQYGALQYILEYQAEGMWPSHYFRIISGVSVGALNGVMLAQNRYTAMGQLWETIRPEDIYRGGLGVFSALWRMVSRRGALLDNTPLKELIDRHVSLEAVDQENCDFMFGVVSAETGRYYHFHARDFNDDLQFRKGILASAAMPVLSPPVAEIITRSGEAYRRLVDGGIRNASPLREVIRQDPDEVVIINGNSPEWSPRGNAHSLEAAVRMWAEITLNELFRQDVREFSHINGILQQLPPDFTVRKPNGTPLKAYRYVLIQPERDLGDALDFSSENIHRYIQQGYQAAKQAYRQAGLA